MPRSKSEEIDVGWRFCTKISDDGRTVQCCFCSKVIKGGITRLKEHLAHKRGNVAPCDKVSAEVKIEMNNLLSEYKEKKKDKQRRVMELEDHIMRGINRDDDDDDDDPLSIRKKEIDSSFNPINLDYIFEDDPLNSWLEEREQPVFEGDDFEWMNFDEERDDNTIQIDDDPIIDLGASPPISYTNNQRSTSEGTSALGRPSDDDGDDGDDGGDDMLPFDQRRGATSNLHGMETYYGRDEPPMHQVPTQTFVRRRRGNEEQLDDIGESSASSNNVAILEQPYPRPNWGEATNIPSPYYPPHVYNEQPQASWENAWNWNMPNEDMAAQYRDHIQIINHGTINYGAVHYDHSTNYGVQPYDSYGQQNMGSYFFGDLGRDDNNNTEEPHRHSFWW